MALREELNVQGDFLFKYHSYFPLVLLVFGLTMIVLGKGSQTWLEDPAIFVSLLGLAIRVNAVAYSEWIENQQWVINKPWLLVMLIVYALSYIIIKLLKRRF